MADFWRNKRVLITGAQGLIGAPLCRMLVDKGVEVTTFDVSEKGLLEDYRLSLYVKAVQGDILNSEAVHQAVRGQQVIFHLAALSGVEDSRKAQARAFDVNVRGTWTVLQAALDCGKIPVAMASSNHIYGQQERYPVPETAPLHQLDTYSATKIMCDYAGQAYAHNYGLPVGIVRNTNCFGPHDPHADHIIPGTILSLLRGERPIIKSRGLTKKSYLYVDDVAEAYLIVGEAIATGRMPPGTAFNVSSEPISVVELVSMVMRIVGQSTNPTIAYPDAPVILGEANDQSDEDMDWSRIKALGWQPRTSLARAIELTVEGFRERRA